MAMKHGGNVYQYDWPMLDFSANLNPLGMPKRVQEAAQAAVVESACYPDPHCTALRKALAERHQLPFMQIVCGNGAADLIDRIALAFRPQKALLLAPTFSEYARALALVGCDIETIILYPEQDFLPTDGLESRIAEVDLVWLCNPNNPSGNVVSRARMRQIARLCKDMQTRLVVDECFMDFVVEEQEASLLPHLQEFSGVILLKAFTKTYAMAGLRLGYALCGNEADAEALHAVLQPWAVSTVASAAGIVALQQEGFVEHTKQYVKVERIRLAGELTRLGCTVYPSQTNFLLFQSKKALCAPLEARGILLRSCANFEALDETYYRTAVRTTEENMCLLAAIKEILEDV